MTLTQRYWWLFLAISSTTVLGAPISPPPACSQTCLDSSLNNFSRGGCPASDTSCLCSWNPYIQQVTQCITSSCSNATQSDLSFSYLADACNAANAAARSTRMTTTTQFITSTQSVSTSALTTSTSPTQTTATTSTSSLTTLQTTTETPIPLPGIIPTIGSPAPSTSASSNAGTEISTNQGTNQTTAIVGSVVGVAALAAIVVILLVVYTRRKNKRRAGGAYQRSQLIGEEVGSPSAIVRPWRVTMLPFASIAQPNIGGFQAEGNSVIDAPPEYDGPGPIRPEKYQPRNAGSSQNSFSAPGIPLTRPRQPGPWNRHKVSLPAEEYHDIGSNFLRG